VGVQSYEVDAIPAPVGFAQQWVKCDNHCWATQESTVVKKWVSLLRVSLYIVGTMVCDRISARMMQGETMTPPPIRHYCNKDVDGVGSRRDVDCQCTQTEHNLQNPWTNVFAQMLTVTLILLSVRLQILHVFHLPNFVYHNIQNRLLNYLLDWLLLPDEICKVLEVNIQLLMFSLNFKKSQLDWFWTLLQSSNLIHWNSNLLCEFWANR
jgi:hypothetical protein